MINEFNRALLLKCFIKYETLTMHDLEDPENTDLIIPGEDLRLLLTSFMAEGLVERLNYLEPVSYTISYKGILEAEKLMKTNQV